MKLIISDGARVELYDVSEDPTEASNISADQKRVVRELLAELDSIKGEHSRLDAADSEPWLTDATREALKALGYID